MISHDGKDYDVWLARKDLANTEHHEYGPWLRAAPFNPGKTPFIVVTGMGDGLGGTTKSSTPSTTKKPPEMAARPNGNNTSRPDYSENGGADRSQATDMETSDLGEHITSNLQKNSNPIIKIQEIDAAIGKFDSCGEHVNHKTEDTSRVSAHIEKPLSTSLPAHSQLIQEQEPHVTEVSAPLNPAIKTLRTWKKLARDNTMETEEIQYPTATK